MAAMLGSDSCLIERVLPRATVFRRRSPGSANRAQVLCANADIALIMTTAPGTPGEAGRHDSALNDFSARRVERYLATLDTRIRPIVLLNKIDLVNDGADVVRYARAAIPGTVVLGISALTGVGLENLTGELSRGETAVLVGSSGCGKSTLVGRLLGKAIRTAGVRPADGRGRHTTTTRRMYEIGNGCLLVDTPGIREVQLWADDSLAGRPVANAFPDIATLSAGCRFRDCRHEGEPGCAVTEAVQSGEVTQERYLSFLELRNESTRTQHLSAKRAVLDERRAARRSRMKRRSRGG